MSITSPLRALILPSITDTGPGATRSLSILGLGCVLALALVLAACGSQGGEGAGSGVSSDSGPHGCFATEATCGGKCVNPNESSAHCGGCDKPCLSGLDKTGTCVDGACVSQCNAGFVDDQGTCKNFFGAHEPFPNDCQGCSTANGHTGGCGCPSPSSELSFAVQSDCPGVAARASTHLNLCVTRGVSQDTDFGGAYQWDDADDWCGATLRCRVGNPLAGGACACPAGQGEAIALRSIIRLPCNDDEVGTQVVLCGNKDVPIRTFGGAFQFDDLAPQCRVANPWTGDCSCPAGTTDRVFRVTVDGAQGLYGSTMHLCTL